MYNKFVYVYIVLYYSCNLLTITKYYYITWSLILMFYIDHQFRDTCTQVICVFTPVHVCVEGCCYNLDFLSEVILFGVVAFLYRWQLRWVLHVSRCVNVYLKWDRQTHSLQLPLRSEVTLPSNQHCAEPGLVIHSRLYQVSKVKV